MATVSAAVQSGRRYEGERDEDASTASTSIALHPLPYAQRQRICDALFLVP